MAGAVIGALRVDLGLNSASFDKGLKGAGNSLSGFKTAAIGIAAAAAAAFATVGYAVAQSVKQMIDQADELGKMAQSIGIPVEELSRLKHAADLSGVSIEELGTAVRRLNVNMIEGADGGTSTAARAFQALGISAKDADGNLKSTTQILTEVSDKFATMRDGVEKTAIATMLFGRAGTQLIPMLNQGSAGLNAMMQEADELGIVIDQKTSRAAEAFNDNLTRLSKVKDGIATQIAARLVPTLQMFSDKLLAAGKDAKFMDEVAKVLDASLRALVATGVVIVATFKTLGQVVATAARAVMAVSKGEFSTAWNILKAGAVDVETTIKNTMDSVSGILYDTATVNTEAAEELSNGIAAPMIMSAEKASKAGAAISQAARQADMEQKRIAAEGARVFEETRTPMEEVAARLERLSFLLKEGAIDWDTYSRAVRQTNAIAVDSSLGMASDIAGALGSIFKKSKAVAIAQAIINTAQAVTKALSAYPPPVSFAMAALQAAAGAVQIASIKRTTENGGGGAASSVRGGGGATAAQAATPQVSQNQGVYINLQGSRYSRDEVVSLIDQINDATADGARLYVGGRD